MSQMTLHFHVLCIEFQRIGSGLVDSPENDSLERKSNSDKIKCDLFKLVKRHQELILYTIVQFEKKILRFNIFTFRFGHRANALYQPMLLAQLICSLAMICLTAFEATLTTHDPLLFLKFAMFAVSVLIQILYWCYYGNRVSHMVKSRKKCFFICLNFLVYSQLKLITLWSVQTGSLETIVSRRITSLLWCALKNHSDSLCTTISRFHMKHSFRYDIHMVILFKLADNKFLFFILQVLSRSYSFFTLFRTISDWMQIYSMFEMMLKWKLLAQNEWINICNDLNVCFVFYNMLYLLSDIFC